MHSFEYFYKQGSSDTNTGISLDHNIQVDVYKLKYETN